jgi:hypothetical protein
MSAEVTQPEKRPRVAASTARRAKSMANSLFAAWSGSDWRLRRCTVHSCDEATDCGQERGADGWSMRSVQPPSSAGARHSAAAQHDYEAGLLGGRQPARRSASGTQPNVQRPHVEADVYERRHDGRLHGRSERGMRGRCVLSGPVSEPRCTCFRLLRVHRGSLCAVALSSGTAPAPQDLRAPAALWLLLPFAPELFTAQPHALVLRLPQKNTLRLLPSTFCANTLTASGASTRGSEEQAAASARPSAGLRSPACGQGRGRGA